ncbi:HYR domain-containing protein [Seonamhaeicola sediminis]|nr:HYR domain-containing protein [Seonamhaeicola sediminis]
MKTNTYSLIAIIRSKTILLFAISFLLAGISEVNAQCTVPNNMTGAQLVTFVTTNAATCDGTVIIPNGIDIFISVDTTIPSSIDRVIIEDGGQIIWTANATLTLAPNTAIVIENTTDLNTSNGTAALSTIGPCNNNKRINIGTVEYTACTGGGNVCIIFSEVVAAGGTIQIDPNIDIDPGLGENQFCFEPTFVDLELNGFVEGTPTYLWTVVSSPSGATVDFAPSNTVEDPTITVSEPGQYVFNVAVTVSLSDECTSTFITVDADIEMEFIAGVTGTLMTVEPDSDGCSLTVDFTGSSSGGLNTEYDWNFGDGNSVDNIQNPSHIYAQDGTYTVTLTIYDPDAIKGCNSVTVSDDITITDTAPTITCPPTVNVSADNGFCYASNVALGDPTVGDDCDTNDLTITKNIPDNFQFPFGSTTVTWTVEDASGNTATCDQTVTVTDSENPTITCATLDASYDTDNGVCTFTVPDASLNPTSALDNCGVASVINDYNNGSTLNGAVFQLGTTTVIWTVTDGSGNTASCSIDVVVIDNENPTITCATPDASYDTDNGVCTFTVPDASLNPTSTLDNCGVASVINDYNNGSTLNGAVFQLGTTTVIWTVTDGSGNTASCSIDVVVTDNQAPVFDCDSLSQIDFNSDSDTVCSNSTDVSVPQANDNCDGTINAVGTRSDNAALNDPWPLGTTTITWTFTDTAGNDTVCTQDVVVTDNQAPVFDCDSLSQIDFNSDSDTVCSNSTDVSVPQANDNCDGTINAVGTRSDNAALNDPWPLGTTTITWTFTDTAGNDTVCTQDVVVTDNQAPFITCPGNLTAMCDISEQPAYTTYAEFTNAGGSANDNCSINEASFTLISEVSDNLSCPETVTRTYQIADMAGNTMTCTQLIIIDDEIVPTITTQAQNIEIECLSDSDADEMALQNWLDTNGGAIATDNCSAVTWTNDYGQDTSVQCENGAITVTFTATDECNNSTSTTATYLIKDTENPTITVPASDQTVQCDGAGNLSEFNTWLSSNAGAEATDDCSAVSWTNNFITLSDDCGMTGSAIVTFRATDACGNFSETTAKFTIEDTIAPEFTVPADIEIFTDADCNYDTSPAVTGDVTDEGDVCSPNIQATYQDETVAGPCEGSVVITRTWTLKDDCDNTTVKTQTITVTDNTAPTFTAPADIEIFTDADCNYDVSVSNVGDVTDEADNCSTGIEATYSDSAPVAGPCEGTFVITRTWSLVDNCGNAAADQIQTITISDNITPTFTAPADIEIFTDADCNYDVSVSNVGDVTDEADNCSTGIEATYSDSAPVAGPCEGTFVITRTWSLVDNCGNAAEDQTQTITISDNIIPTFTAPADIEIFTNADCNYDVSVSNVGDVTDEADNCSTGIQATYSDSAPVAGPCEGTFVITRTWSLVDSCGNAAEDQTQTITISDNTAPTFTAPADIEIFTDADCNYDVSVANVGDVTDEADNCSTGIEATYSDSAPVAGPCEGTFVITRTWSLVDSCGNAAEDQTQTITISDNTAPTFTAPADIEIFTDADCNYDVSVANVGDVTDEADNCSTGIEATYADSEPVAGPCEGTFVITRTWSLVDNCGNAAEDQTQTITISDNTAPTFTAPADIEIFTDADCNYDVSVGNVGDVTDEADNCSTGIEATYSDSAPVAGPCEGTFVITRTWSLVDNCGNAAEDQTQTITISDNTAPTFTAPADIEIFTDADCNYDVSVGNVGDVTDEADNCSTSIEATYADSEPVAGPCEGTFVITRTWSLVDNCGNAAEDQTQTITISDNTAPTFTAPADITINCQDDVSDLAISGDVTDESDNCSTGIEARYSDSIADGDCPNERIITRTWSLVDNCNNPAADQVQIITVIDDEAPELVTQLPGTISVSCDAIPDAPELGFADNCSENVQVTFSEEYMYTTNATEEYEIIRKWTAVDECNNTRVVEQIVTVSIDEFVSQVTDEACADDGVINLDDYINDFNDDASWTFVSGVTNNINFVGSEFDPSNLVTVGSDTNFLGDYVFSYTYTSPTGCLETTEVTININDDCIVFPCSSDDIIISKAVTPNGDFYNQSFDIDADPNCGFTSEVKIFNRWGALIYESNNYPIGANESGSPDPAKWEGQANGSIGNADKAPNGTYYYIVILKNSDGSASGLAPFTGPVYLGTK